MCLPIVARVLSVDGESAEVELRGDGGTASVSLMLCPDVGSGQYVLIDRGLVLEVIDEAQAEQLLQFYAELAGMWDEAEGEPAAEPLPAWALAEQAAALQPAPAAIAGVVARLPARGGGEGAAGHAPGQDEAATAAGREAARA